MFLIQVLSSNLSSNPIPLHQCIATQWWFVFQLKHDLCLFVSFCIFPLILAEQPRSLSWDEIILGVFHELSRKNCTWRCSSLGYRQLLSSSSVLPKLLLQKIWILQFTMAHQLFYFFQSNFTLGAVQRIDWVRLKASCHWTWAPLEIEFFG